MLFSFFSSPGRAQAFVRPVSWALFLPEFFSSISSVGSYPVVKIYETVVGIFQWEMGGGDDLGGHARQKL
jgi:hypothetical protein